jgi:hypothetical protein
MSLKAEFDKEIYKTAMISLLFDYYKKYKEEGLNIPESVNSYTKTYFANESIKGWIEENLKQSNKDRILLKQISTLYAEATDKKLSVKQLREELVGLGYVVTRNDGEYALKNWILKTRQDTLTEDENENVNDDIEYIEDGVEYIEDYVDFIEDDVESIEDDVEFI